MDYSLGRAEAKRKAAEADQQGVGESFAALDASRPPPEAA